VRAGAAALSRLTPGRLPVESSTCARPVQHSFNALLQRWLCAPGPLPHQDVQPGPEARESERGCRDHASLRNTMITGQPLLPR
jgi:hypothetical protein